MEKKTNKKEMEKNYGHLCRTLKEQLRIYRAAKKQVQEEGTLTESKNGQMYQNPALGIANSCIERCLKIIKSLEDLQEKYGFSENPLDEIKTTMQDIKDKYGPGPSKNNN